jgi:hypothetical protein
MPATADEKHRIKLYLQLMEEIRLRFEIINNTHQNTVGVRPEFVREIGFLQFRLICETIAIACIIAHGNRDKRVLRRYEPAVVMQELRKLNPHFYPQPVEIEIAEKDGVKGTRITGRQNEKDHLKQNDLTNLWSVAGDELHRTPLNKLTKRRHPSGASFSDIFHWGAKLTGLLSSHLIVLNDTRSLVVFLMSIEAGKPIAWLMDHFPSERRVEIEVFSGL